MEIEPRKDLIALTADKNAQFALQGLLVRHQSLGARTVSFDILVHPERDPGCYLRGDQLLRAFTRRYAHALVLFDREGSGRESLAREQLEDDLENRLSQSGWSDRAAAIALDPELEIWVWSDSSEVDAVLGWADRQPALRAWLADQGYLGENDRKPTRPKEAVEIALRIARRPRSSSLYGELARKVGLERCTDPAFAKFKRMMRAWFPAG